MAAVGLCDESQPIGVLLVVLVDGAPRMKGSSLAQEREATHDGPARRSREVEHPAFLGTLDLADKMDLVTPQERSKRLEEAGRVVVACDGDDGAIPVSQ